MMINKLKNQRKLIDIRINRMKGDPGKEIEKEYRQ